MRTEYEPRLVEQAVFLACREDRRLEAELHAATDALYAAPRGRSAAFESVYAGFFTKLRLDATLAARLSERPLIARHVGRCIVREAARRKDESAELFVRKSDGAPAPADRTLVIQTRPESLLDSDRLSAWLRRELLHVSDMLDGRFGYRREALEGLPARQNLMRDRYRVLWDVFVEGRLTREGHADAAVARHLQALLQRAFNATPETARAAFDRVFCARALTHRRLLGWAARPETLLDAPNRSGRSSEKQSPGGPCPLCGFPTHDWYPFHTADTDSIAEAIRTHRADWRRETGACRQCAEIYADLRSEGRTNTTTQGFSDEAAPRTRGRSPEKEHLSRLHL